MKDYHHQIRLLGPVVPWAFVFFGVSGGFWLAWKEISQILEYKDNASRKIITTCEKYLYCCCCLGCFFFPFDCIFYCSGFLCKTFLCWSLFDNWKGKNKLEKLSKIRKRIEELLEEQVKSKSLSFHTFIYWRFYVNVFYANMKVSFETVQSMLSWNDSLRQLLRVLSKNFHKIPTNEPIWKQRAEGHTEINRW